MYKFKAGSVADITLGVVAWYASRDRRCWLMPA